MKNNNVQRIKDAYLVFEHCDPNLERAVKEFFENLTNSYSLTSRNPSLYRLFKDKLDEPFELVLKNYFGENSREVLGKFKASDIFYPTIISSAKSKTRTYKNICSNFKSWGKLLEKTISNESNTNQRNSDLRLKTKFNTFSDSIYTLIFLVEDLSSLNPSRERNENTKSKCTVKPSKGSRKYCEFCWKHSMSYDEKNKNNIDNQKRLAQRYCKDHDPYSNRIGYEKGRRKNSKFQHELKALRDPSLSNYITTPANYPFFKSLDTQERRKAVYDLIYSGLDTPRFKCVIKLYLEKKTISEIARELSISRQAVSNTIKEIEKKINQLRRIVYIDPSTGEPQCTS